MIKLDLKHFKHESSDDNSTTLRHVKDNHSITLAHKALSPANQEQLKALAKASQKPMDKAEAKQDVERTQMANGGKVDKQPPKKRNNTIVTPSAQSGVEQSNDMRKDERPEHGRVINVDKDEYEKRTKFADGGDVPDALKPTDDSQPQQMPAININVGGQPVGQVSPPVQAATPAPMAAPPGAKSPTSAMSDQQWSALPEADKRSFFDPQTKTADGSTAGSNMLGKLGEMRMANDAAKAQGLEQYGIPNNPAIPPQPMVQAPDELPQAVTKPVDAKADLNSMDDYSSMLKKGFQSQMAGVQDAAKAQAQMGKDQEAALAQNVKAQETAKLEYKGQYDKLEQERQAHMADIQNGHIDPNMYWTGDKNGNGSHSRVATAIGMIVAGFNPTSKPNAAMDMLKYQMDQNIKAQEMNLNSDQNLLAANLRQFGNLKDATDMTKLMQADIIHNQLLQASAKASTPMAKAAAETAAGQLMQTYAPLQQQIAMRQAMMKLSDAGNGDPTNTQAAEHMISYARMTNPEMAKEMESRLIPGVGMAKIPVPESARKEINEKQQLNNAAADLMAYSKKHSNVVPGTPDYNFGVAKALAFQQKVREGLLGTVFRESEKPLLEKFVSDNPAGALKSFTTQPQLRAIIDSNTMGLNSLKQSYGLPQAQPAQSNEPVKGKDGKMYIRQGQFMVPVK